MLVASVAHDARAQLPAGDHTVYGELKVDESKAVGLVPLSFDLSLVNEAGRVVERQSVIPNTRYRFLNVRNGLYELVVETGGQQVTRFRIHIAAPGRSEYKQDITLAWDRAGSGRRDPKSGTVDAADFYQRTPANQELFDKATAALGRKKFDEAAALLNKLVAADPKDYKAWTDLGTASYALDKQTEAEAAYTRALAEKPGYLTAAVNLGRLRVLTKSYDKAVEILKPAVGEHPQSADAHHLLGEAYLQTRMFPEAIAHFDEAVRLEPQAKADLHLRLAAIYDAGGMKDRAAAELEQFLPKRPDRPNRKKMEQYVKDNKKR
jgi:tetratricopeptide (TPR) repeat protein